MCKEKLLLIRLLILTACVALLLAMPYPAQQPTPSPAASPIGGPASIFTAYDESTLSRGEWKLSEAWDKYDLDVQKKEIRSRLLARTVSYNLILPRGYFEQKSQERRYSVVYLLHGLAGHYNNWIELTKVASYAMEYDFIIVMPEGNDGWFTDSATVPNDKYESYIVKELIPEIDGKYRTVPDRAHRAIAGLSMGGYGAIKFGLKYPNMFSLVGSFSGALTAPLPAAIDIAPTWKELIDSLASVYGPQDSKTRRDNDAFRLLNEMPIEKLKALPFIYLACGTEDNLLKTNRDFDALLLDKKLPHEFRESPAKHEWPYWDRQVDEFLRVAGRLGFGMEMSARSK